MGSAPQGDGGPARDCDPGQSERLRQVHHLFDEALARPAEERSAYLDQACGADVELRREVESLIAHHASIREGFLSPLPPIASALPPGLVPPGGPSRTPDSPATPPAPAANLVGQRIGRFHIKSVIAVGGMGTVYEATQDHPRRVVALKVMNPGIGSTSALRRFQYEAQMLGRLRHPNIAQVYEAGMHGEEAASVPYFAMEYIPGARPITLYAREKNLAPRERLALFAKVCDAVHHGHQKGIIHRDLKPANILVDSAGEPKVIDFGVARAVDSDLAITTQQTHIGQLVGTMQYMSPEQCDADPHDLDTRSDVYSLGVVLYELLADELPYRTSSTIYQAVKVIKECVPRRLSLLSRRFRGDIETIVAKALEKDRDRRYASAAELAADIRRHLSGDPIEARRPALWTRITRWIARHPVATATGACLFIGALCATAGAWAGWAYKRVYEAEPREIQIGPDGRAVLLSNGGATLHTWDCGKIGSIITLPMGRLVERPARLGGGKLAILGFASDCTTYSGTLCAFDVRDRDRPVWTAQVANNEVPNDPRVQRGFAFSPSKLASADVFGDDGVPEIIVHFVYGPYSQIAIRIYDLAGQLLYQAWHDGTADPPLWIPDEGLLVFSGNDGTLYWEQRGHQIEGKEISHPLVVFALRPKRGWIDREFLCCEPDHPNSPACQGKLGLSGEPVQSDPQARQEPVRAPCTAATPRPVWYRCLLPAKVSDVAYIRSVEPAWGVRGTAGGIIRVDIAFRFRELGDPCIGMFLDANGNQVGTRISTDGYTRNRDRLAGLLGSNPDDVRFDELPPIARSGEGPSGQP